MKTSADPRHKIRQQLLQHLFSAAFRKKPDSYSKPIWDNLATIDPLIAKGAPEWPIEKLNHVDLAILRLAVFELVIDKKQPVKVIIDEAIELAKEFGGDTSPGFINGALGAIVKII
jgi:transcription antitermination factor NusB